MRVGADICVFIINLDGRYEVVRFKALLSTRTRARARMREEEADKKSVISGSTTATTMGGADSCSRSELGVASLAATSESTIVA